MVDRRVPVAASVLRAAQMLEEGWGKELKPEERLRRAVAACALERSDVLEVRLRPEWRPTLKQWPSKPKNPLGGFDLAFRMKGDGEVTVAAETKWSGGTGPDALDQTPWDALKLVHARELSEVRWALLITAAPVKAWNVARYATAFDESVTPIVEFLKLNPRMYADDAKSRPLALPPYVQTSPTVRAALDLGGKQWEIRVASVRGNGEPWLACDEDGWPSVSDDNAVMDWPYPEPGLGMQHDDFRAESAQSTASVPTQDATWSEIIRFAEQVDGYRSHGDALADLANRSVAFFAEHGALDPTLPLADLRACLFFEYRRYHHFGCAPGYEETPYIRALVAAIAAASPGSR